MPVRVLVHSLLCPPSKGATSYSSSRIWRLTSLQKEACKRSAIVCDGPGSGDVISPQSNVLPGSCIGGRILCFLIEPACRIRWVVVFLGPICKPQGAESVHHNG